MKTSPRLLLVGWDSADWKIIQPLIAAGEMPAMARLLHEGVSGNLTTIEPQLSPMLWTSIATGKHAYHHGVPGFTEVNHAGQVVPVSAATRRCKALWDILGERGLRSHVVSWFATQGEQPNGCLVSNLYNNWKHGREDAAADWPAPPPGTYWPADLGQHLNELRVSPWDISPDEILRLFVPEAATIDQAKDRRLWNLTQRLSEAFSVHSATCWLLEHRPDWNFFAVYYRAIDEICHMFMPYHPPQMGGVKDADFALYQHVVRAAYRLHDLFLARLMNLAGPETAIVLVSDHGFHSDHLRPAFTPRVPAGITIWHRPQGVFCAMGPGFRKGESVYGARLLDITPTLLTWFGLPVGADMEGRVLLDAFAEKPQVATLPSWEQTGVARRFAEPLTAEDQKALLDQFVELGYIDPVSEDSSQAAIEANRENDWNLARACMDGGRYDQALALLESICQLSPQRHDYAQLLAICQLRLGLHEESRATLERCVGVVGGAGVNATLVLANIALETKRPAEATQHLETLLRQAREKPDVQLLGVIARLQQALRLWDEARASHQRILELDPANAGAFLGIARVALHTGQHEAAVTHALEAIGVQYGNPQGHFLLGVALVGLERWEEASRALGSCIALNPKNGLAQRYLAVCLEKLGRPQESEIVLMQSRLQRVTNVEEQARRLKQLRSESAQRATELGKLIAERQAQAEARRQAQEASGLPKDQEFVLVSGLPRSGTSLMMQILRAGGLEPMTDGQRVADEDNPEGYWEWEEIRQLPKNPLLIEKAHGKATKVILALLSALPPKHRYKVIFMRRPVGEVVHSQARMLERRGTQQRATTEHLEAMQEQQVQKTLAALRQSPRIDLLEVPYPELVADPQLWCARVAEFVDPDKLPQAADMPACVRPKLYRNRHANEAHA